MARHTEHQHFQSATFTEITLPGSSVGNDDIEAGAGVEAEKLEHHHSITGNQPNTTATTETRVIHVVYGTTGDVLAFEAGTIVACIDDSSDDSVNITLDLLKNGVSILVAVIDLDENDTARIVQEAAIDTAGLVDGDVLEVVIVATAGTGTLGTGLFYTLRLNEDAQ